MTRERRDCTLCRGTGCTQEGTLDACGACARVAEAQYQAATRATIAAARRQKQINPPTTDNIPAHAG